VKQSIDLEISPRSSTVVSRESGRVAKYAKCSEDSERKKRKSPFSTTTLSDAPSPANSGEYLQKPYTARNYVTWATCLYGRSIVFMGIGSVGIARYCTKFLATPIISGTVRMGKAPDLKFGSHIHKVYPNRSPLKFWRKVIVGVSRHCPILGVSHVISGIGKTTDFKFCTHIHRFDPKKGP